MNSGRDRDGSVERLLQRSLARGDSSPAGAGGECPDPETLAAWVDGGLGKHEVRLLEAHASECARCQAVLAAVVQTAPDSALLAPQEGWRHGWRLRWLVPLAATAAAAVILWVVVPNDARPDRLARAGAQLRKASPAPPRPEARTDRFNAPAVSPEPPRAANETRAAKAENKTARAGTSEGEQRNKDGTSERQPAAAQLDALSARAAAAPSAADGARAQSKSVPSETLTLSRPESSVARRGVSAATIEITSPDPSVRWRIGGGGSVERTMNGGTTWEAVPTGVSAELTAGSSPTRLVCWLVGRAGTVLLSTDGRTWRRVPFPDISDLVAVQAADVQTAAITTADGRMFRTTDGGLTWN